MWLSGERMNKFLIIAAHPDDELLGCGAYVSQLITAGWKGKSLILGEGMTSRGEHNKSALTQLKEDGTRANQRKFSEKL